MTRIRSMFAAACLGAMPFTVAACASLPDEVDRAEIDRDSRQALTTLYAENKAAKAIGAQSQAVLVFPSIVKGALGVGGAYGAGEMIQGGRTENYYSSFTGSWGLQAGAQSYGYVVFLMNKDAVDYIEESDGWEIGVGPTVVVVNAGVAQNLSTTSLQDDAYAFIFDQKGLMAGLSIEGTKITKLK
ncbi:MAG: lipid-binding SYLF domain-containing protein [Hyphomonas sp.]